MLAALENIVPPVPADTAVALGAFLAARGAPVHPVGVFAVTLVANVASALGVFLAAHRYGRPFFATRLGRRLLSERAQQRIGHLYQRHHLWGIFISRFLPGYRAVVPPFAGISGLGLKQVVLPLVGASALYYGTLVVAVYQLGENWDAVVGAVGTVGLVLLAVALAVTVLIAWLWRREHRGPA
ncbi:MAG TPA: DedA family protein [Gemmatimonadales bacterium]|nr:DedA family protein [Gemmatimonadales bacterium]